MAIKKFSITIIILLFISALISCKERTYGTSSDLVKVTLRDVGHKMLLANKDSISIVKPIIALEAFKYQLSFEEALSIQPDSLVAIINNSFAKAELPEYYLTEVIDCQNKEVVYSYQVKQNIEKSIIPCRGRELKKACYTITIQFENKTPTEEQKGFKSIYIICLSLLLLFGLLAYKRKTIELEQNKNDLEYASIGRFKFYPDQNKLIKEAMEISISKKECELLALLVSRPNQVIKRDELMKKVWEDNGVIVGRSLDTYVSKLRKKLKEDDSIKITNVHGVGYKLEI